MELLVYLAILLVIAAIISLVLSFVGTVLVGALRLLPLVHSKVIMTEWRFSTSIRV